MTGRTGWAMAVFLLLSLGAGIPVGLSALAQSEPASLRMHQVSQEERTRLALALDQLRTLVEATEAQQQAASSEAEQAQIEAAYTEQEGSILVTHGFTRQRYEQLLTLYLGDPDFQTVINRLVTASRRS